MTAMIDTAYQAALDDIYASFMRVKHLNKGRFDRDARQPQRLLEIARDRGIIPPPERILKVSGSKGKGTTARIAARLLQNELPDAKIGLFVSPEEDDHNDRMRINGAIMTRKQFVHHFERLTPQLEKSKAELSGPDYLSPLGIFLLIALDWFHTQDVDYFVLETGRGVAHDEVGQIPSKVGVLTSIMLEHADKLGPKIGDIAADKLSLVKMCDRTVFAPASVRDVALQFSPDTADDIKVTDTPSGNGKVPQWLHLNANLARKATEYLLDRPHRRGMPEDQDLSASFGIRNIGRHTYVFEGLIHTSSLDASMLDGWQNDDLTTSVIASFPDDKDREQLLAAFKVRGWPVTECVLTGTRGYLDYARTEADSTGIRMTCAFDDIATLAAWLVARSASRAPGRTYLVGTQTYIRLVRKALALMPQPGGHDATTRNQ
jgi:Mur ligase middle domain